NALVNGHAFSQSLGLGFGTAKILADKSSNYLKEIATTTAVLLEPRNRGILVLVAGDGDYEPVLEEFLK
ncbi:17171_t:CDS:1, partial [Funneliformis caledonium]